MSQSENKLSPCMMVRKPPIDDIQYRSLSYEDGTSDDEKGCISFEDLKCKAKETKEDLKKSFGLEGSLREGNEKKYFYNRTQGYAPEKH